MRVEFKAEINSGNDAFQDNPVLEIQRIVNAAFDRFYTDDETVPLRDVNGNKVGEMTITLEND